MPVKILLADKSITIQKVVEMLFSGRDYEVMCVSDGETALSEAARAIPDVVLADVDLPRVDGYTFAERLKKTPSLAKTPVILMMSRDDVYDSAKGEKAGIIDSIAKPFESQELIGKVKKALSGAPPRPAEPARPVEKPAAKPKKAAPDIFDIIREAPTDEDVKKAVAAAPVTEEVVYEVEPEVEEVEIEEIEIEEPLVSETATALPVGDKAVEEMRVGLGLSDTPEKAQTRAVPAGFPGVAVETEHKPPPSPKPVAQPPAPAISEDALRKMVEESVARMAKEAFAKASPPPVPAISPSELWGMAEKTISKMAEEMFKDMPRPPLPKIPDETVSKGLEAALSKIARDLAKEVFEQVAWEVIPPLAEHLIKEEIERLKAMQ
jgi:DNA-binding response OmpR family regulator